MSEPEFKCEWYHSEGPDCSGFTIEDVFFILLVSTVALVILIILLVCICCSMNKTNVGGQQTAPMAVMLAGEQPFQGRHSYEYIK
jgi:hypothetical protein